MSDDKINIENAVELAKKQNINIEYKCLNDKYFYIKISSSFGDGNRNYIFSHIPYEDIQGISQEKLLERIKVFANHSIWKQ